MRIRGILVLGLVVAAFVAQAAQFEKATASVLADKAVVVAGGTMTVRVSVTFPQGYHAYQNPPSVEFEIPVKVVLGKSSTFKLVKVKYPKGIPMAVGGEPKPSAVYTDTISIPVVLKAPTKAGSTAVDLTVSYQQCNEASCLPPDSVNVSTKVTIKAAAKKKS